MSGPNKRKLATLYARVSSHKQKEEGTIDSQVATLLQYAKDNNFEVPEGWIFKDEGVSGYTIQRPGLDNLRDLLAAGGPDVVLILQPDRLARKYAYQILLAEEFQKCAVDVFYSKNKPATTPEDIMLQQFQGVFAEYERAQITERCRRGRLHKAKIGSLTILPQAPYGYRYIREKGSDSARYELDIEESTTVSSMFKMYVCEGMSIQNICNYLNQKGIQPRKSTHGWDSTTIRSMFQNQTYIGLAAYGKTEAC